ncbi:dihydrolipoamide dehydrogenase [Flavobacteriaceae bacterium LYZ1037]|nr:dihydrolipoamide dehydrogenase [Flavobacteriaceae bacterium LYZ1037]
MKKILLFIAVVALSFNMNAQVTTPQPSPLSKVEQKVGLTDVTIEYSRPGVKGRVVFGDLVPFDKLWRTGANKNTVITFSDNVTIMDQLLKAGSYAIFVKPGKAVWEVMFYTDTDNGGTPDKWDDSKVAARVNAEVHAIPFNVETFTIDINQITNSSASIEFIWEKTFTAVPFQVPTDDKVLASINDALNGTPTANDYYASAVYYSQEGKDMKQAKAWIDKAMGMSEKPAFWQLRQQSLIYAKSGDKKGAIEIAKKSLEGAKEAGNDDFIKMNMDSIAEWEK